MPGTAPRTASVLIVVAGMLASLLISLGQAPAADAAASAGRVRGYVLAPHGARPLLKVSWFTADWTYLGSRAVSRGGAYSLSLPAGTYRLQFADKRPSYDVTKLATTDATVVVRPARTAVKNVRMQRGSAITGTVRTGGKPGSKATVIAASKDERSFATVANAQGQFAIGGLPRGSYSVFTYDHKKTYVGKSTFVRRIGPGQPQNVAVHLTKRAGGLLVDLYAGDRAVGGTVVVTAVSKVTGQFWTTKARGGTAVFQGLYPGRYRLVAPGYGDFLGRTGDVANGQVRPGRTAFGSFRLTQHGGSFTGRLVAADDDSPVGRATVRLYDAGGAIIAAATTAADGTFRVGGRLATSKGISLVAFDSAHLGLFDTLTVPALSIKAGQTKRLGDLVLPTLPSAAVSGYVVDASNKAIRLAGATVRLLDARDVVIATTTSDDDGGFLMDERLAAQSGVTILVQPGGTSDYLGDPATRCEYTSTKHGGIVLETDVERDLGPVGMTRKARGTCLAPIGDPVTH
ncbi:MULTISPECIES: carboxypeptidase-like regulatory domain-containing protein [unclassified Nocardioides]|uniref:carboxypeptidase-like regulatory domain-containing protein n=1 Tax=unclassified Nocardioides TaxID=2615069 RepID=UPI0009EFDD80|nr:MULTISPECIES: carboxypeptidase-like regulatory domain-containing protein [unclassified Nocardioides]GAW50738.1 uncharacterized protein (Precursor) [Nocardioides sp. PD653-B2]GAW55477.1 uncharacterized protein (Precursor) [Nocardioides sp. PD653]